VPALLVFGKARDSAGSDPSWTGARVREAPLR